MNIAIAGSGGRMGVTLIGAVLDSADARLAAALDVKGGANIGHDAGALLGKTTGITISDDIGAVSAADCLIDFTRPEGTLAHVDACVRAGVKMVIGTTGFDEAGKGLIVAAAKKIPIVFAPNMAIGVNAAFRLAEVAAQILGDDFDVEIIETHHRHKVDAPSGTAIRLGEVVAGALGRELKDCAVYGREGITGERDRKSIAFHSLRGGDIVGDHTVVFAGTGERVEVTVKSQSRATYAIGALRAALFLKDKSTGLYDMQDVLGLRHR
jgi:4-hydroxy-tetrahydrodipicolinate reductase